MNNEADYIRTVYWTDEFEQFYDALPEKVQVKFDYVIEIVKTVRVVSSKFVKHLKGTDLYEMRVSIGTNEYRTVLFTMDNDNVINASEIVLLNAFLKKSEKDYKQQVKIAQKILKGIEYGND